MFESQVTTGIVSMQAVHINMPLPQSSIIWFWYMQTKCENMCTTEAAFVFISK